jgi:type IV secretion system protein VirB8
MMNKPDQKLKVVEQSKAKSKKVNTMNDVLQDHLKKGKEWENDVVHHLKKQRNISYVFNGAFLLVIALMSIVLISLFPLKQIEPLIIEVEKSTGQVFVKTDLINSIEQIDEKNAVIEALLARYLIAWKTYEYTDNLERQKFIRAMSTNEVYRDDYLAIWQSDDERINPNLKYGPKDTAEVEIISIIELNENTHQARIAVIEKRANYSNPITEHFVVIIKHQIAPAGMRQKDRWTNPIGILVESIRFDEEYID